MNIMVQIKKKKKLSIKSYTCYYVFILLNDNKWRKLLDCNKIMKNNFDMCIVKFSLTLFGSFQSIKEKHIFTQNLYIFFHSFIITRELNKCWWLYSHSSLCNFTKRR